MRRLYLLTAIFIGFTLSNCATNHVNQPLPVVENKAPNQTVSQHSKKTEQLPKSPIAIQVYPKGTEITHPYKVIAKKSVSKYNIAGIKRQEANIHDALRNLAASLGGDAVINVTRENRKVTGTIVSFENKKIGQL